MTMPILSNIYFIAKLLKNIYKCAGFRVLSTITVFFLSEISVDLVYFPI